MIRPKRLIKDILFFLALLLFHVAYIYFGTNTFGDKSVHFEKIQWNPSKPAEQGIHPFRLKTAADYADSRLPAARSMIVIKNGKTILEKYLRKSAPVDSYYLHSLNSMVLELLVGVAEQEKMLSSTDAPLAGFFPAWFAQNPDINKADPTVNSLLEVEAPLLWGNDNPEYWQLFYAHDKIAASLDLLFADRGTDNPAANFAAAFLLGEIIGQISGMDVFKFAEKYLFTPMGIERYENTTAGHSPEQRFIGFQLKTLDLAKLGYLFMQNGKWQDRQLLPPGRTRKVLLTSQPSSDSIMAGKWQHHVFNKRKVVVSKGEGGQLLALFPEDDMVVAVNSNSLFPLPQVNGYDSLLEIAAESFQKKGESLEQVISYAGDPTERSYYEPNFVFSTRVPGDIQQFFRDFASDIATGDVRKVIYHYARGYEKDDDTFRSVPGNWYEMYAGGTGELESVEINKVRVEKNRAYLRGSIKYSYANMQQGLDGWFPMESLIKLRGRWQWFGSPVYAEILDRDEYFDAAVTDDIATFIDTCGNAFIGGYQVEKKCFAESFIYNGADRAKVSNILIPFLKDSLKSDLHLTRVEPDKTKQLVEGYFFTKKLGEISLPPGMQIVQENGSWKWLGNGVSQ
jgi:CubicO group peptidase (beta-lactamase class C family)